MAGIVPVLGCIGVLAQRATRTLAAHGAVITDSRKAQQKLGKLINRHTAHTASQDKQLPETACPGPDNPLVGREAK